MDVRRMAFEKMFRGKTKIPYKLRVRGEDYQLALKVQWKYKFFERFTQKMQTKTGDKIKMPDEFKADEKSYNFILKNLDKPIKKIQNRERKKLPGFKIHSMNIQEAKFKRDGENILLLLLIYGVCRHDV